MKCEQFNMLVWWVWLCSIFYLYSFPSLAFCQSFYPFLNTSWLICSCACDYDLWYDYDYDYDFMSVMCECVLVSKRKGVRLTASPSLACRRPVQYDWHLSWSVNNHRVHTHSLFRHWARRRQCIVLLCVSLKRTKWKISDHVTSIKVMSLCRRRLVASAKLPKCNNTGEMVRTSDLGVMSPARCRCATPVTMLVTAFYVQLDGSLL